jgi:hypothetical protein
MFPRCPDRSLTVEQPAEVARLTHLTQGEAEQPRQVALRLLWRPSMLKRLSIYLFGHDVTAACEQNRLAFAPLDCGRQLHADAAALAVAGRICR